MAEPGTYLAKAYKQKEAAKEYSFATCPFGGQSAQWESRKMARPTPIRSAAPCSSGPSNRCDSRAGHPHMKTKIKSGSRMVFRMAPLRVAIMA